MHTNKFLKTRTNKNRRGNILVLAAAALIMIMGFTAFSIDIGYITLTKAQLQNAADAAALAAAADLAAGIPPASTQSTTQTETLARQSATTVAAANSAGGGTSGVYLDGTG